MQTREVIARISVTEGAYDACSFLEDEASWMNGVCLKQIFEKTDDETELACRYRNYVAEWLFNTEFDKKSVASPLSFDEWLKTLCEEVAA